MSHLKNCRLKLLPRIWLFGYLPNGKGCKEITWTGGEPTDQLTEEIVAHFKEKGYYQAIETSGLNPTPKGIDFVCISPKVAEHVIKKNFKGIEIEY